VETARLVAVGRTPTRRAIRTRWRRLREAIAQGQAASHRAAVGNGLPVRQVAGGCACAVADDAERASAIRSRACATRLIPAGQLRSKAQARPQRRGRGAARAKREGGFGPVGGPDLACPERRGAAPIGSGPEPMHSRRRPKTRASASLAQWIIRVEHRDPVMPPTGNVRSCAPPRGSPLARRGVVDTGPSCPGSRKSAARSALSALTATMRAARGPWRSSGRRVSRRLVRQRRGAWRSPVRLGSPRCARRPRKAWRHQRRHRRGCPLATDPSC
jgi:hypothetical protein